MEVILKKKTRDPWSKLIKYKNCFDYIAPYWTRSGNVYTGLTPEDEKRLEKALGYNDGHLSPQSPYWTMFCIKLGERELIINTDNNPFAELQYLFLKNHKRVATSLVDIKPATDYVLINKDAEAKESNTLNRRRREAIKTFDKMSLEDMRKCLRLYGYRADSMSAELVESKLFALVEENPDKYFLKWVNNKAKDTEYIIAQALSKNILRKSRNVYYYGTDIIGNSLEDAISYLNNAANQDLKLTIISEIGSK